MAAVWTLKPAIAGLFTQLGNRRAARGRPAAALRWYERALSLSPGLAVTHYKRGNAFMALHRPADAAASYSEALRLRPDYGDALYNRGLALQALKQAAAALADFDGVLRLNPEDAQALNNRGNVLLELKRPADAIAAYDRALASHPAYSQALHNRALAQLDVKRPDEAVDSLTRLIELAPDYPFAQGKLLHAKMLACDWRDLQPLAAAVAAGVRAGRKAAEPFGYQAVAESARDLQACATLYAAEIHPGSRPPLPPAPRYAHARIRLGYVAGEFREQATAFLLTGLFEMHDQSRFDVFAFDNGWDDGSETRRRIARAVDDIIPITGLADEAVASLIRQHEIDILINLNGYFGQARPDVFGLKPAPVQVNYLGFPGTLGADYIDYIIADRTVIPPDEQSFYTEKVAYLPDTYQVNDSRRRISPLTPTRSAGGLPENAFVFCCFNNNYKITPEFFAVWMRLLQCIPDSVLWLFADNPAAARNLREAAAARGIAPGRLVFAQHTALGDHLARHRLADLFLDTLPYNAHTTASDALWAGLPLITCRGTTFPGRVAASLLSAIGLPELITLSLEEYAALATRLATTPALLAAVREKLATNRATYPLFDTRRYCRHLEAAYTIMWERHQRGEAPAGFAVASIDY